MTSTGGVAANFLRARILSTILNATEEKFRSDTVGKNKISNKRRAGEVTLRPGVDLLGTSVV